MTEKQMLRLRRIDEEARRKSVEWAEQFSDDWDGKIRFSMVVASAMMTLCRISPGLHLATFVEDVKSAAELWAEAGFPKNEKEASRNA